MRSPQACLIPRFGWQGARGLPGPHTWPRPMFSEHSQGVHCTNLDAAPPRLFRLLCHHPLKYLICLWDCGPLSPLACALRTMGSSASLAVAPLVPRTWSAPKASGSSPSSPGLASSVSLRPPCPEPPSLPHSMSPLPGMSQGGGTVYGVAPTCGQPSSRLPCTVAFCPARKRASLVFLGALRQVPHDTKFLEDKSWAALADVTGKGGLWHLIRGPWPSKTLANYLLTPLPFTCHTHRQALLSHFYQWGN